MPNRAGSASRTNRYGVAAERVTRNWRAPKRQRLSLAGQSELERRVLGRQHFGSKSATAELRVFPRNQELANAGGIHVEFGGVIRILDRVAHHADAMFAQQRTIAVGVGRQSD